MNKTDTINTNAVDLWGSSSESILNSLLKTAPLIPAISAYHAEETRQLKAAIPLNAKVIDFGCGNGRHLNMLGGIITTGLGIDINTQLLEDAKRCVVNDNVVFRREDIETFTSNQAVDVAFSMYNTIGIVENPQQAINSMFTSVRRGGKVLLSVFSKASIEPRVKMYRLMGLQDIQITEEKITTAEGLVSRHFSKAEILQLLPSANIQ